MIRLIHAFQVKQMLRRFSGKRCVLNVTKMALAFLTRIAKLRLIKDISELPSTFDPSQVQTYIYVDFIIRNFIVVLIFVCIESNVN